MRDGRTEDRTVTRPKPSSSEVTSVTATRFRSGLHAWPTNPLQGNPKAPAEDDGQTKRADPTKAYQPRPGLPATIIITAEPVRRSSTTTGVTGARVIELRRASRHAACAEAQIADSVGGREVRMSDAGAIAGLSALDRSANGAEPNCGVSHGVRPVASA